jgi:hypothetical protein
MSIKVDSEEEADFLGKVIISLGQSPIPDVMSADQTQAVAQVISKVFDSVWIHHAKAKRACACSMSWWDTDCNWAKASAITSDLPADWMAFKKATRKAKCKHFDECINEIAHTNLQPWDLMDWVSVVVITDLLMHIPYILVSPSFHFLSPFHSISQLPHFSLTSLFPSF